MTISRALASAANLAADLQTISPKLTDDRVTVTVSGNDEHDRPLISVEVDNTDGALTPTDDRIELIASAAGLSWGDAGDGWREWTGTLPEGEADVSLVLYCPGDPLTRWERARLRLTGKRTTLAAAAGVGAAAALTTRHALTLRGDR